jgi:Ribbon-helix-helix protein, copG family
MATDKRTPTRRLNLEVGPKAREKLERMSEETEQSFSEVIRNALALYDLLWSELKGGRTLVVREADGKGEKEVILPELRS